MTFDALSDAVTKSLSDTRNGTENIRLLLGRLPKEHYAIFYDFFRRDLAEHGSKDLTLLAQCVTRFNDGLIEQGNMTEVIEDLEEKLTRLAPTLLDLGLFSATPPKMSWAIIQNHYRLVANNRMLLFDFTKTEFELIQKIKLDRAVRLVHRDTGEFIPYARSCLNPSA